MRYWYCVSFLNWIAVFMLSLLQKPSKKNRSLDSFYGVCFFNVVLYQYKSTISGLVLLITTWIFWTSCRNGYVRVLIIHLLLLLNFWLIARMCSTLVCLYLLRAERNRLGCLALKMKTLTLIRDIKTIFEF